MSGLPPLFLNELQPLETVDLLINLPDELLYQFPCDVPEQPLGDVPPAASLPEQWPLVTPAPTPLPMAPAPVNDAHTMLHTPMPVSLSPPSTPLLPDHGLLVRDFVNHLSRDEYMALKKTVPNNERKTLQHLRGRAKNNDNCKKSRARAKQKMIDLQEENKALRAENRALRLELETLRATRKTP